MSQYSYDSSGAFVNTQVIEATAPGALDGLAFAVKDLIDVKGEVTGCGNPTWAATHPPADAHAVCVEQLLSCGATYKGKTVTDELAFSLIGENHFYGTPINPQAPQCVPGGSSSGSASAVACQLVDFSLGTDTGGSVRVPASNCGVVGYRPTHGLISVAGVMPFAPTFDTVGVMARDVDVLSTVVGVLTGHRGHKADTADASIYLLDDIFKVCDQPVQDALSPVIADIGCEKTTLSDVVGQNVTYETLLASYSALQHAEIWSSLGAWIKQHKPEFGSVTHGNFYNLSAQIDRVASQKHIEFREFFAAQLHGFLHQGHVLCFPTTPACAPAKNTLGSDQGQRSIGNYYPRALGIDAISGLSRAAQITLPLAHCGSIPMGLSFLSASYTDHQLCQLGVRVAEGLS